MQCSPSFDWNWGKQNHPTACRHQLHPRFRVLQQGKCLRYPPERVGGVKIVSNHPLTVVGGHDCVQIPTEYGNCDPISTQIPPTVNWGNSFLLPPLTSRTNGQRYKIIASENNTIAEIKCGTNVTKTVLLPNDGDIYQFDTNSNEYCTVLTSNPSYVVEYGFGHDYLSDGYGDPLLMNWNSIYTVSHSQPLKLCPKKFQHFGTLLQPDIFI